MNTPSSLQPIADRVAARLDGFLARELARWSDVDERLADPIGGIGQLVAAGGKRLRPAFCHWGYLAAGGNPDDSIVADAGAAIELLHAMALFHDDVLDNAVSRRGQETIHHRFAREHGVRGGDGESRRFGEGIAILAGDLAGVYADQLVADINMSARNIWNELRVEVNAGQILDVVGTAYGVESVAQAERICRYKSGKYTVERPLHLGAALADPARFDAFVEPLSAYGLPLGDAFQMRDDVIGVFSDETITGKPVGTDLREGKPTPLLGRAIVAATSAQREVLDNVGDPDMAPETIAAIQQVIVDTGALADLESTIAARVDAAITAISAAPINPLARDELVEVATFISERRS